MITYNKWVVVNERGWYMSQSPLLEKNPKFDRLLRNAWTFDEKPKRPVIRRGLKAVRVTTAEYFFVNHSYSDATVINMIEYPMGTQPNWVYDSPAAAREAMIKDLEGVLQFSKKKDMIRNKIEETRRARHWTEIEKLI